MSISLLFTSHFNTFSLFEQPSLKIKFSIINISSNFIVSLSFVQNILNDFNTYREMINSAILVSGRAASFVCTNLSYNCSLLFKLYFTITKSFVFSGLSRNRCMNNLSVSKSCFFFISEFLFCFVVGITGGSIKF